VGTGDSDPRVGFPTSIPTSILVSTCAGARLVSSLTDHIHHCKIAMDILRKEKLYLSKSKIRFIPEELTLLGRVIDANGIRMDPEKVIGVLAWKTPTNRDLLRGFIGSVGYLADDIPNIRLPLGILSAITGDAVPFRWTNVEQRAFDEVKKLTHMARNHSRKPITYGTDAPQVWMVTDGCSTGIAGVVSQGNDWKTAIIAAFYSAKLNNAQRNYPVHEIEMLAGVETMLRHRDVLQGVHFKWITDHKGLIYLLNQKAVSGRQARWIEKISSFAFTVEYAAGSENVLADALSRIYSNDSPGTERAESEYTVFDNDDDDPAELVTDMVLLAGLDAVVATHRNSEESGAETGRPESSKEFARRMKDRFVLRGPQERTKGGSGSTTPPTTTFTTHITSDQQSTTDHVGDPSFINVDHDLNQPITEPDSEPNPDTSLVNILESDADIDLLKELRGHYEDDPIFRTILDRPKDFRNFEVKDKIVYLKLNGKCLLCIPKVTINGRSVHEIIISEAHSLLAHLGANKTLNYLRDHVWWKDMVSHTKAYCETCITCKRSKPNNQKPYGLLNPLAVPSEPWESIGVDFVGPLPLSSNRDGEFDSITVVICLLTAMVEIIPSRTNYKAPEIAELMFEHVYKHHGLPKTIVSYRDVLFTSTFWNHLNKLIGIQLKMSSAYHPQTDGATERANRTVTQMMRQCINPNQKDWVSKLPAIQFAINSARSESTGYAPFFLNNGRMPRVMVWNSAGTAEYSNVREFAQRKKLALISAHDSIIGARIKQTRDANRKRQLVPFKEGDFVYLSTKNITFAKGLARKLIPKYVGPYKILRDFNNQSFKLELPMHLKKRGVHDVFHSSLLRIHAPNDDRLFPGCMDTQIGDGPDTEDEWAVDLIRSHTGSGENSVFEMVWKSGDVTWMPYYQIRHLQALETYLELQGVGSVSKLTTGKGKPPQDDPQIVLGAITFSPPFISPSQRSLIPAPVSHSKHIHTNPSPLQFSDISDHLSPPKLSLYISLSSSNNSLHPAYLVDLLLNFTIVIMLPGIHHPRLFRLTKTDYAVDNPAFIHREVIHVGQVAKHLAFDKALRDGRQPSNVSGGVPVGYQEFAELFNAGVFPNDKRRLSTFYSTPTGEHVVKSTNPVSLRDFHITPEQCGLVTPRSTTLTADQASVFEEYATVMASQSKRRRESYQTREDKRRTLFNKPDSKKRKKERFNPYMVDFTDSDSHMSFPINSFDNAPHASTSQPTPEHVAHTTDVAVNSVAYYNADPEPTIAPGLEKMFVPEDASNEIPMQPEHEEPETPEPENMQV
jgi:hypothetical protein